MNLQWARAATKHRISRERSRYVIEHCGLRFEQEPPADAPAGTSSRLVFLGDIAEGVALEVMAEKTKSGAEITPEIADALAVEAERGYDLSKAKRRRVGRPSLAGHGASPRMSFRATPDLYRAAQKRAKKEGRSVSDLAREAVARYVGS